MLDNYPGQPTALDVRFVGDRSSDLIEIYLESQPRRIYCDPIVIGKKNLKRLAGELIGGLNSYRNSKSFFELKKLASMGHDAYESILATVDDVTRKRWEDLLKSRNDVRHSVIRTDYQSNVTFPIALLCTSKPDTKSYSALADKFVASRSVVINSLGLVRKRKDNREHISNRSPCNLAHAIDETVPGALNEQKYLASISGLISQKCLDKASLFESWNNNETAIVHFSSHHLHNESQYILSLTQGEFQSFSDIKNITRREKDLPFIFINGCNTGNIFEGEVDTFIRQLCPLHTVGILSTLHSVGGNDSALFAAKFYNNWIAGRFAVDALIRTKEYFIYHKHDFSAITYEFWEMPEVLKLFN